MFNSMLKRIKTLLLFRSMVINGLKCIETNIGLDTCTARGMKIKEEVSSSD